MDGVVVKVTIKDVAKRAGVSTATVSYVINNTNRVGPDTKERVLDAVAHLGYQPNAMAQGLVMRKTRTLGLIIPHTAEFVFSDPYFPAMLKGVGGVASSRGYFLLLSLPQSGQDFTTTCSNLLTQQRVDGVVLVCTPREAKAVSNFPGMQVPVVLLGDSYTNDIPSVDIDNEAGSYKAAQHVVSLGHRYIGYIAGDMRYDYSVARYRGFQRALVERGLEPAGVHMGDFTKPSGIAGARQLLQQNPAITAIVCANDLMALGAAELLQEMGVNVPEQVSLVGFDDIPMAASAVVPLTTVRQPVVELGRQAAELLLEVIEHSDIANHKRVLTTELVVRSSSRAPLPDDSRSEGSH